jgi:GNAT superfamily N-acetyltransferase
VIAVEQHAAIAAERDLDAIAALTATAITGTHLHRDPRLPVDRTRRLYAAWARNDAAGRAQRTIVARDGGEVVGYLSILRTGGTGVIDLIAVDPARQGRGIGTALLASYLEWLRQEGLSGRVGTQSDNPVLSLYRRVGFVPRYRQCAYHLWLDD